MNIDKNIQPWHIRLTLYLYEWLFGLMGPNNSLVLWLERFLLYKTQWESELNIALALDNQAMIEGMLNRWRQQDRESTSPSCLADIRLSSLLVKSQGQHDKKNPVLIALQKKKYSALKAMLSYLVQPGNNPCEVSRIITKCMPDAIQGGYTASNGQFIAGYWILMELYNNWSSAGSTKDMPLEQAQCTMLLYKQFFEPVTKEFNNNDRPLYILSHLTVGQEQEQSYLMAATLADNNRNSAIELFAAGLLTVTRNESECTGINWFSLFRVLQILSERKNNTLDISPRALEHLKLSGYYALCNLLDIYPRTLGGIERLLTFIKSIQGRIPDNFIDYDLVTSGGTTNTLAGENLIKKLLSLGNLDLARYFMEHIFIIPTLDKEGPDLHFAEPDINAEQASGDKLPIRRIVVALRMLAQQKRQDARRLVSWGELRKTYITRQDNEERVNVWEIYDNSDTQYLAPNLINATIEILDVFHVAPSHNRQILSYLLSILHVNVEPKFWDQWMQWRFAELQLNDAGDIASTEHNKLVQGCLFSLLQLACRYDGDTAISLPLCIGGDEDLRGLPALIVRSGLDSKTKIAVLRVLQDVVQTYCMTIQGQPFAWRLFYHSYTERETSMIEDIMSQFMGEEIPLALEAALDISMAGITLGPQSNNGQPSVNDGLSDYKRGLAILSNQSGWTEDIKMSVALVLTRGVIRRSWHQQLFNNEAITIDCAYNDITRILKEAGLTEDLFSKIMLALPQLTREEAHKLHNKCVLRGEPELPAIDIAHALINILRSSELSGDLKQQLSYAWLNTLEGRGKLFLDTQQRLVELLQAVYRDESNSSLATYQNYFVTTAKTNPRNISLFLKGMATYYQRSDKKAKTSMLELCQKLLIDLSASDARETLIEAFAGKVSIRFAEGLAEALIAPGEINSAAQGFTVAHLCCISSLNASKPDCITQSLRFTINQCRKTAMSDQDIGQISEAFRVTQNHTPSDQWLNKYKKTCSDLVQGKIKWQDFGANLEGILNDYTNDLRAQQNHMNTAKTGKEEAPSKFSSLLRKLPNVLQRASATPAQAENKSHHSMHLP